MNATKNNDEYFGPGYHYCDSKGVEVVPEGVVKISAHSFSNCRSLRHVALPFTLKEIGNIAFCGCCALEEIVLPNSLKVIGDRAFAGCSALKEIVLPNGLEKIGTAVFRDCKSLSKIVIPRSLKEMGMFCFDGLESLSQIVIEDLESWGRVRCSDYDHYRFVSNKPELWLNDRRLDDVVVPLSLTSGEVKYLNPMAFSAYSNIKNVVYPEGSKFTNLCFDYCENLQSVVYPESVESLNLSVFRGCRRLSSIKFPLRVTSRCTGSFHKDCKAGSLVECSDGVQYVGGWCVGGDCESALIKEGTIGIASGAFRDCEKLKEVVIPSSVRRIGYQAFSFCPNLIGVLFNGATPEIDRDAFENRIWNDAAGFGAVIVVVRDEALADMGDLKILKRPYKILISQNGEFKPLAFTRIIWDGGLEASLA